MSRAEAVAEGLVLAFEARKLVNQGLKIAVAADAPFPARMEMLLKIAETEMGFGVDSRLPNELANFGIDLDRGEQTYLYSVLARFFAQHDKLIQAETALEWCEGVDGPWEANVYLALAEARAKEQLDPKPMLSRAKQIAGRVFIDDRMGVSVSGKFRDLLSLAASHHRVGINPLPQVNEAIDYGETMGLHGMEIYPQAAAVLAEAGQIKEALEAADKIPEWPRAERSYRAETLYKIASQQVLADNVERAKQTAVKSGRHDVISFILAESAIGLANGGEQDPRPAIAGAIRHAEKATASSFSYQERFVPSELWATIFRAQRVNLINSNRAYGLALQEVEKLSDRYERGMALVAIGEQSRLAGLSPDRLLIQAGEIAGNMFVGPLKEKAGMGDVLDFIQQQFLYVDIAEASVASGNFQLALDIADRLDDAADKVGVMTAAAAEMGRRGLSQQAIAALSPQEVKMAAQSGDKRVEQAIALFGIGAVSGSE